MRIAVLGGAGFIGAHVCRRLLRLYPKAYIVVIDNLWTGLESNVPDGVQLNKASVSDLLAHGSLDWLGQFDQVWHLASPASPKWYMPRPIATIRANVDGAMLATKIVKPGGAIFFTSTSEVYGDPLVSPQPETYRGSVSTTGVRSAYDEGKRCAEALLMGWHRESGGRVKIARIFNCYGPFTRPDDGRAVSEFLTQGLRDQALTIFGSGEQTRCFGHVDDIVDGLMHLFHDTPDDFLGPLNIGLDDEISVLELAQFIAHDLFGGRVSYVHLPPAPDDPQQRRPDLTLCREVIPMWQPRINWRKGVEDTLEWFRCRDA